MTANLRKVAVMRPGRSLIQADPKLWHYGPLFNPDLVQDNHKSFIQILEENGIEIYWMDEGNCNIADAVFTYDASLMTPLGAILMSPGKKQRAGEQDIHREFYQNLGISIRGSIENHGRAEAGDTLWLEDRTLLIGHGFRTNGEGIRQLKKLIRPMGIKTHTFDLPTHLGPEACLHLMSLISMVDTKTALICAELLPPNLLKLLKNKEFNIIEAPYDEFEKSNTLSTNVLALSPGNCLMIDGFPKTRKVLLDSGIKVQVFDGEALCIGCEGGPTCLTRPLLRN